MTRTMALRIGLPLAALLVLVLRFGHPTQEPTLATRPEIPLPPPTPAEQPLPSISAGSPLRLLLDPHLRPVDPRHPWMGAAAATLAADPRVDTICPLSPPLALGDAVLIFGDPRGAPPFDARLVPLRNGLAYLADLGDHRDGWLLVDGFGATPLHWEARGPGGPGACAPITLAVPTRTVQGQVVDPNGAPFGPALVEGCGALSWTDDEGTFVLHPLDGDCSVRALRAAGTALYRSVPAALPAGEAPLTLTLSPTPRVSLGFGLREDPEGLTVDRLTAGGGAAAAGLQVGDRLRALNGASVEGMSIPDFLLLANGEEGSAATLTLDRGGVIVEIAVRRLHPSPPPP